MIYSNPEKNDLLLELLIDGCGRDEVEEFKNLDVSNVTFSKRYYRKRKRIINSVIWRPRLLSLKRVASRVAIVFLAVLSMGFVTVMAIPPLRDAVIETVSEWFDDHVEITYTDENGDTDNTSAVNKIEKLNKPINLPVEVEEEIVVDSDTVYMSDFYMGELWLGTFKQHVKKEGLIIGIDTEETVIYEIVVNENELSVYDRGIKGIVIYWEDAHYVYTLTGEDLDDLMDLFKAIG